MNYLQLREAIAATAASHHNDCGCRTCQAAAGDSRALEELVMAVAQLAHADEEARSR